MSGTSWRISPAASPVNLGRHCGGSGRPCIAAHTRAGRAGHVDVVDAVRGVQRVDDRVDDRGRRPDVRRLADALGAERVVRARRDRLAELEVGTLERRRDQVVHERRVEAVALLVEREHLHQRDADAFGEAAVDLAVDDHRVDAHAAVVDRDEAPDGDMSRVGVDVDDGDVGAVGVGEVRRVVDHLCVEPALHSGRQLLAAVGPGRDLVDERALLRVALDVPAALLPREIVRARLEHRRGDQPRLVAHLARDDRDRAAGDRRRAASVGAEPVRRPVRVAVADLDVLGRDAELLGDDLRERRLVALPLRLAADADHRLARRVHPQVGAVVHGQPEDVHVLARPGADALGEEGDADAHQLAAGALLGLLAPQLLVAGDAPWPRASSRRSSRSRTSSRSSSRTGTARGR